MIRFMFGFFVANEKLILIKFPFLSLSLSLSLSPSSALLIFKNFKEKNGAQILKKGENVFGNTRQREGERTELCSLLSERRKKLFVNEKESSVYSA